MAKNGGGDRIWISVAGHNISRSTYSLYRTLSYAVLADDFWHEKFLILGVALSKSNLTIFVQKEVAGITAKMSELATEKVLIREIGPIFSAASGGDSTGAGSGSHASGTFGCLVEDTKKTPYGLSCDHVVGTLAGQSVGDEVWSPGKARGGTSKSKIGEFNRGSSIVLSTSSSNRVDGALIRLDKPSSHAQSINGISGAPTGVNRTISFGDTLKKSGVATGVTNGQFAYLVTMNVPYNTGRARFVDQIGIDGGGVIFADHGDSGAIVLDASNMVAGLLFLRCAPVLFGLCKFYRRRRDRIGSYCFMKLTSRELAADALTELESRPHVVGVARDRNDCLILLLDEDDEGTRSAADVWAKSHSTKICVKVIGKLVSS